jgi:hypothetical protein
MKKKMVNRKQCSDCGLYLVDGRHDLSGRGVNKENLMSVEEFERNLSALLKVPPLRKEKAKKEKIIVAQTGKETEIKPLLGKLKIKEIEKWVKETIVAIDSLIFELFPNSLRKIPHLNTYIRYELDKVHLLCLGVRQSKL